MADTTDVERMVADLRSLIMEVKDKQPEVAATLAFDAVTNLLVVVIDELRELRLRGIQSNA